MSAKCFFPGCKEEVVLSCSCKSEKIFTCVSHIKKHNEEPGKHILEDPYLKIKSEEFEELIKKIQDRISILSSLKNDLLSQFKKFLSVIFINQNKILKKITDEVNYGINVLVNLLKSPNRQIAQYWNNNLRKYEYAWDSNYKINIKEINDIIELVSLSVEEILIKQPKQRRIGIYNDKNNSKEFFVSEEIITTKPQIIESFKQTTMIETVHLKKIASEESSLIIQDAEIFSKLWSEYEQKTNCNLPKKYFNLNSNHIENIEDVPIYSHVTSHFRTTILKGVYQDNQVAIKTKQPISWAADLSKIFNEIDMYTELSDQAGADNWFIKYYGTCASNNQIYMIIKYSDKNLMAFINDLKAKKTYLSETILINMYRSGINSFTQMANKGIFHRDIKPQNLLVENPYNIKIIDFSISLKINSKDIEDYSIAGSSEYSAPEMQVLLDSNELRGQYNLQKADIFSLGLIFLQIMTLCDISSFNRIDQNSRLIEFISSEVPYEWAKNLLLTMLNIDPRQRMLFFLLKKFIPE